MNFLLMIEIEVGILYNVSCSILISIFLSIFFNQINANIYKLEYVHLGGYLSIESNLSNFVCYITI